MGAGGPRKSTLRTAPSRGSSRTFDATSLRGAPARGVPAAKAVLIPRVGPRARRTGALFGGVSAAKAVRVRARVPVRVHAAMIVVVASALAGGVSAAQAIPKACTAVSARGACALLGGVASAQAVRVGGCVATRVMVAVVVVVKILVIRSALAGEYPRLRQSQNPSPEPAPGAPEHCSAEYPRLKQSS